MKNGIQRGTAEIICPFFRGHTVCDIGCEGITPDCTIKLYFRNPAARKTHEKIFCGNHYRNCELFPAIMKQYEEG